MTKPHEQTIETAEPDPQLVHGIVAALKNRLADYQSACVASIDQLICSLQGVVAEPSPGLTDEIIAELEAARRALDTLDVERAADADALEAISRRLKLLAQTTAVLLASDVGMAARAGA